MYDFKRQYADHKRRIERLIAVSVARRVPGSVYDPIRYVMSGGGKRLRAVLTLVACEAVGGKIADALHPAVAVELLHNFTLVHDDVMDHSALRRNRKTVHEKWDVNTAILAGDETVALAYASMLRAGRKNAPAMLSVFTEAFNDVCEGQGLDKEFEMRGDVTVSEYCSMIRKKTARMISAAAEIGGIAGGGRAGERAALRTFGERIGMAFQMNDDLLDIMGDEREFGKPIGGDIAEGKKTLLLLRAIERASGSDRKVLRSLRPGTGVTRSFVERVRGIYDTTGSAGAVRRDIRKMTAAAKRSLASLPANRGRAMLSWLADELLERTA